MHVIVLYGVVGWRIFWLLLTMTRLVVTIRYRWADLVLPLGMVVLLPLLIVSSEIRRVVTDRWICDSVVLWRYSV